MSPRRRLSHARRTQILEATAEVIGQRGFSDTRVADIAERAGTSAALILYYFESKDVLLAEAKVGRFGEAGPGDALAGMPAGLQTYVERESLPEGTVLIRQDERPDDVFVLESGRLRVEMRTLEGTRIRLRSVLPGLMVGEVALYTGARTADVVAEEPSVVLRLRRSAIERMESEEPELARVLHRWLAETLAERLTDTQRAVEALTD